MPAFRALRYRDFRLLWVGAFLSFTGSAVQTVVQGYLVFQITGDSAKLAMVTFVAMLPVSIFGPVLGVISDMYDKRWILIACMVISAIGPCFLGVAAYGHFLAYWHFLVVSAVAGFVTCIEVPTRQSIVRSVVSEEDLAAAIPAQASTFNMARVIGPVLGSTLAASFGAPVCFIANGLSFFALAASALLIKSDLRPLVKRVEPVRDLVLEGLRYTFRNRSIRTLFLLEASTAVFASFYVAVLPAITTKQLGLGQMGLGVASSFVGIGALAGLITTASLSQKPYKTFMVRISMLLMALCTTSLAFVHLPVVAYPLLAMMGACTIIQFNTTNTLFQLLSPPGLRGRVISMHMWAISGIAPIGVFAFGVLAQNHGLPVALALGGVILLLCWVWGWTQRKSIIEPKPIGTGAA